MKKKIVYKISKGDKLFFDVYQDGTAFEYSKVVDPFFDEFLKDRINDVDTEPENTLIRCGLFWNPKYERSFIAVCILTDGSPEPNDDGKPFNGYEVEYFGEGKPWERAVPEGAVI